MSAPSPAKKPIPFGKYLLLDRINIGGMAEIWRGKTFGAGGFERLLDLLHGVAEVALARLILSPARRMNAGLSVQRIDAEAAVVGQGGKAGEVGGGAAAEAEQPGEGLVDPLALQAVGHRELAVQAGGHPAIVTDDQSSAGRTAGTSSSLPCSPGSRAACTMSPSAPPRPYRRSSAASISAGTPTQGRTGLPANSSIAPMV